jgi:signal transduction histidine kinase/CheY-like chemotaxis protein
MVPWPPIHSRDDTVIGSGKLFRKYAVAFAGLVGAILIMGGLFQILLSYRDNRAAAEALEQEKAAGAAQRIERYVRQIADQIAWAMLPSLEVSGGFVLSQRFEFRKLLRQVPAVSAIAQVDSLGKERLRVSRIELDAIESGRDRSREASYREARSGRTYYGPVYFRQGTEPYMIIATSAPYKAAGIAIAEVDLRAIWDAVSQIRLGRTGYAYVVDARGRLIAHPDASRVLQETDFSLLPQVAAALASNSDIRQGSASTALDAKDRRVLTAWTKIPALGWSVIVEQPLAEAFEPVYASAQGTVLLLVLGLGLALLASLLLATRMVKPIHALQIGAARIGMGILDQDIRIATGDELEALGNQFNLMSARLREHNSTLEQKVKDRTRQLENVNLARSRLIAAASHDLRQPLHALGLFVAQWRAENEPSEQQRILVRVESAIGALRGLFDALLDISKLDAGALVPELAPFPLDPLLKRVEATFLESARAKGLRLRVRSSRDWVHSDQVMLERILINLVSNALRYTSRGGIVLAARRRANSVCIGVWDSGIGIPQNEHSHIFEEFYQVEATRKEGGGLGLGLAIVDRLCRLLGHPLDLVSVPGKGSRFTLAVPAIAPLRVQDAQARHLMEFDDPMSGKRVLIIDDDPMVLNGMVGLLKSWGCSVTTAGTAAEALASIDGGNKNPDVIISDYGLSDGDTGIELIARLRRAIGTRVPAVLITGIAEPRRLLECVTEDCPLLRKPVSAMTLRAVLNSAVLGTGATRRPS